MNKKPIKFIIPRIHKINDCLYIQWNGKEYYMKESMIKEIINKIFSKYFLIDFLLLILILIISDVFPIKNVEDILRMLLLVTITGIQSGIAIIEDRENNNR